MALIHRMRLTDEMFEKVFSETKTIEVRLYDEKRSGIKPGHGIIFKNAEKEEKQIAVRVLSVHIYYSFEDLFTEEDIEKCGLKASITAKEAVVAMGSYYNQSEIDRYRTVAFHIEVIPMEYALLKELEYEEEMREKEFEKYFPDGIK